MERKKPYVKVGVLGGSRNRRPGEPITNVELALVHEFGAPSKGIPERSFIRAPFAAKRAEYLKMLRGLVGGVFFKGEMSIEKALAIMGERIAADFKKSMPGTPPPNAESTLRKKLSLTRKGSTGDPRSLVDTGRLLNSITYEVVNGD